MPSPSPPAKVHAPLRPASEGDPRGCYSAEGETKDIRHGGDGEWKLVSEKATALKKQEQRYVPSREQSRESGVLASAGAIPSKWYLGFCGVGPYVCVGRYVSVGYLKRDFCDPTSSAGYGGFIQARTNMS